MTTNVFVGNIPYNDEKEDLKKTLSLVGPVKSLEIKQDDKSNSKGFGFCEYENEEIAASALRNLDKLDYKGRQLRIGPPDKNSGDILSEEEKLLKKDIAFIKESSAIKDEKEKNNVNNNKKNKYNLKNILMDLSDEQKFLLLFSMKTMNNKDDFKNLLLNQNEDTLNAIIALQNDIISRYKDK
jgi:RNA recognition motif-containing protein